MNTKKHATHPSIRSNSDHKHTHNTPDLWEPLRLAIATASAATLFLITFIPGIPPQLTANWIQFLLATPVQFFAAAPFYASAWKALKNKRANMYTLITLGTSVAYWLLYFHHTLWWIATSSHRKSTRIF